jgi:Rad3-related DNA helicase
LGRLARDDGAMLEGVSVDAHSCPHFTIEMETGTGKTYVYFRTMLELLPALRLRKFIIVVPSVAILEGVKKTFEMMRTTSIGALRGDALLAPAGLRRQQARPHRTDFARDTFAGRCWS